MSEYHEYQYHELLSIDPLAEAERMTGRSYKNDGETMRIGFGLALALNEGKRVVAESCGDSHYAMDLAETLALYADMGFDEVLCDEFQGRETAETFRILWRRDGLLATVESYQGSHRNSTKVYYNVAIRDRSDLWSRTSSGRLHEGDIWVGDHDGREGIRTNLARLAEVGEFLPVWVERPFLWLINYAETDGDYDYRAINAERISRLPAHVRSAVEGVSPC